MKTIGILGGMGPLATADLFQKIILNTEAHSDNDHIHILVDNNTEIPDRTNHILGEGKNPLPILIESALRLELLGAQLIIMPCNTAHYYYADIKHFLHVPFLNMIEETAKEIKIKSPVTERVGLLATSGTYASGIYDKIFQQYGLTVIKPDKDQQQVIMEIIYGVKSGMSDLDIDAFTKVLNRLKEQNIQTYVLGCTELPIAWQKFGLEESFIDPTVILAKSAIRAVGKKVKGEFN